VATTVAPIAEICASAKQASRTLATLGADVKDAALEAVSDALLERSPEILAANARDLEAGREGRAQRGTARPALAGPGADQRDRGGHPQDRVAA